MSGVFALWLFCSVMFTFWATVNGGAAGFGASLIVSFFFLIMASLWVAI